MGVGGVGDWEGVSDVGGILKCKHISKGINSEKINLKILHFFTQKERRFLLSPQYLYIMLNST